MGISPNRRESTVTVLYLQTNFSNVRRFPELFGENQRSIALDEITPKSRQNFALP